MNIGKLRQIIAELPDSAQILVPAPDHSYRRADACSTTALFDKSTSSWTEDYGEDETPQEEYGERLQVLVIM